jgi:hypothetical protein
MKKLLIITGMLLATINLSKAQCNSNYYRFEEGAEFELTNYNDKDKPESRTVSKITKIEEDAGAYKATMHLQMYDKKDKLIHEGDYEVLCDGNTIKVDMERFVPSEMMSAYQDMEVTMDGDYLEIPTDLEVGQTLPDGAISMQVKMAGADMNLSDIKVNIINRKVETEESVTTPAGTFNCIKLTYDTETNMKAMGMGRKMLFKSVDWLAEGVGVIKTETFDDKGKLQSYSLLTSYK